MPRSEYIIKANCKQAYQQTHTRRTRPATTTLYFEHLLQKILPHSRQWWRRRVTLNNLPQSEQEVQDESSTHLASCCSLNNSFSRAILSLVEAVVLNTAFPKSDMATQ